MDYISYVFIRAFGFLIALLPRPLFYEFGRMAGDLAYVLHYPWRKIAMCNLQIAYPNYSEKLRKKIARKSFQNIMLTCLEFFRIKKMQKDVDKQFIHRGASDEVKRIHREGHGIVFFTGHLANWEAPFVGTVAELGAGIAIGRPIKNRFLYRWVLSVREMRGGKIVMPKHALKEGIKALKRGEFVGIVGDQALPESSYSYPLFGTRAWTSSAPALLAYKTGSPLVVGLTKRQRGQFILSPCTPIWPDREQPVKEEVPRMMNAAMKQFEEGIRHNPNQWMWVHNRWKQQGIDHLKRQYRYGFVLITLPTDPHPYLELLPLFRHLYPRSFLTIYAPEGTEIDLKDASIKFYKKESDLLVRDFRQQLIIDLYDSKKLRHHYRRLGAFKTLTFEQMQKISRESDPYLIIKHALIKEVCQRTVSF